MVKRVDLKKIKNLRKSRKITQKHMAKKLGYESDTGYHYIESGKRKMTAEQLIIIAFELGVREDELYASDTTVMVIRKEKINQSSQLSHVDKLYQHQRN